MILATIKQFNQKQLILVQGEDSKKGYLIYLTRKGSFQVILYKMIRFLSGKLKKHMKLAKIVKISIFVNRLVFPMNFNQFSHPMTVITGKMKPTFKWFLSHDWSTCFTQKLNFRQMLSSKFKKSEKVQPPLRLSLQP